MRSPLEGTQALFAYIVGGRTISWTHADFVSCLRSYLVKLGFDPSTYSGHSFRRGGCSACFEAGLSITEIKLRGDWKSQSFERYLYVPVSAVYNSARVLADFAGSKIV